MITAVTGHRPQDLGGYSAMPRLEDFAVQVLQREQPERVLTGMALGFDMAIAVACVRLDIPFTAAVPFKGQESIWPVESQRTYHNLLEQAAEIVVVCDGGFAAWKMQKRNCWLVDHAAKLLSLYNGKPHGGTFNCIEYAKKKSLPIVNVWDDWIRLSSASCPQ